MQFLIAVLLSAFTPFQSPPYASAVRRSDPVLVRNVVDGDTIDVAMVGRVRLLGIDAPEIGRGFDPAAPYAREARERLVSMVLNRWVRLEQEAPFEDVYSRHLAYVLREDGVFVNAELVRLGLARISARAPLARLDELRRAEAEAQAFRRGMWGTAPGTPAASYTSSLASAKTRPLTIKTRRAAKAPAAKKKKKA
jgi:endonuclease YncB( thermonuclease family)